MGNPLQVVVRTFGQLRAHPYWALLGSAGLLGALDLIGYLQTGATLMEGWLGEQWLTAFIASPYFRVLCLAVVATALWRIGKVATAKDAETKNYLGEDRKRTASIVRKLADRNLRHQEVRHLRDNIAAATVRLSEGKHSAEKWFGDQLVNVYYIRIEHELERFQPPPVTYYQQISPQAFVGNAGIVPMHTVNSAPGPAGDINPMYDPALNEGFKNSLRAILREREEYLARLSAYALEQERGLGDLDRYIEQELLT